MLYVEFGFKFVMVNRVLVTFNLVEYLSSNGWGGIVRFAASGEYRIWYVTGSFTGNTSFDLFHEIPIEFGVMLVACKFSGIPKKSTNVKLKPTN